MHLFHCAPQYIIAIAWCIISVNGNANPIIQVSTADFVSQVEEVVEDKLRNVTSFNNLTRCSSTELSLSKESLLYTWEMKGLLGYYSFMNRFNQLFELKTEEISFKSDIVDGKWFFKLAKIISSPGKDELVLTSTYSYEAKQAKKLNFHIQLSIIHEDKEIVLPIKKSSNPVVMQQRLYNRRGYSSYFEYVHTFTWTNVEQAMENIIKQAAAASQSQSSSTTEAPEDQEQQRNSSPEEDRGEILLGGNEDIVFRFLINSYFPSDPVYSGSENCQVASLGELGLQGLIRDGDSKHFTKRHINPPYVKHSNSMLHDERFADVLLKAGDNEFHAHRIILATSSPVFSALLHNETERYLTDEASNGTAEMESTDPLIIHLDGNLTREVVTELLRYIYTGRANSVDKYASKLIIVADKYGLPELKRLCEKILFTKVKPTNAIEIYSLGHEVSSSVLTQKAFAVMKINKSKIVSQSEEFRRLTAKHPSLMFELFLS